MQLRYAQTQARSHGTLVVTIIARGEVQRAATEHHTRLGGQGHFGERSLHRWLKEPNFNKCYRRARREVFSLSIAMTQRYSAVAVNNLAKIMNDPGAHNTARVSAAVALLRYGRESIELDDLAARVDQLEAEQQEEKP